MLLEDCKVEKLMCDSQVHVLSDMFLNLKEIFGLIQQLSLSHIRSKLKCMSLGKKQHHYMRYTQTQSYVLNKALGWVNL